MVEFQPSKLVAWVRFPSLAPKKLQGLRPCSFCFFETYVRSPFIWKAINHIGYELSLDVGHCSSSIILAMFSV